jgi:hypothetical protein
MMWDRFDEIVQRCAVVLIALIMWAMFVASVVVLCLGPPWYGCLGAIWFGGIGLFGGYVMTGEVFRP